MQMQLTAWVTIASLVVYIWMMINVGRARGKFNVKAPEMNGPPEFMSAVRVQGNTVEQMPIFLPALWMCALFLGDLWAAAGGVLWIVGRILYALGYYKDPSKRMLGFAVTTTANYALLIGTAVGLLTN